VDIKHNRITLVTYQCTKPIEK